mmetsp:Transcript_22622/g.90674  ORF Transcript_22622/g.90674 Transcript_22622/m.90674 type:complete len:96 (+) Transcript_22622:408-695(+)
MKAQYKLFLFLLPYAFCVFNQRGGERVFDMDMNLIGTISSGTYSPTLLKPISMAYLKKPFNKAGTDVQVNVRGRMNRAKVEKMPFVEARYYRAPE